MNTQVMSGSDKLHEDYQARKRHREWWVDLNRDIGGGFPEEGTLEVTLAMGLQEARESHMCMSWERRAPS